MRKTNYLLYALIILINYITSLKYSVRYVGILI